MCIPTQFRFPPIIWIKPLVKNRLPKAHKAHKSSYTTKVVVTLCLCLWNTQIQILRKEESRQGCRLSFFVNEPFFVFEGYPSKVLVISTCYLFGKIINSSGKINQKIIIRVKIKSRRCLGLVHNMIIAPSIGDYYDRLIINL